MRALIKAVELDPANLEAHLALAHLLAAQGRSRKAQQQYQVAMLLDPSNASALSGLGLICYSQGRYRDALQFFQKALKSEPENTDRLFDTALALARLDKTKVALRYLNRVIRQNPKSADAYLEKGSLLGETGGHVTQERRCYELALKIDPCNVVASYNLARLFEERLHRVRDAQRWYQKAVRYAQDSHQRREIAMRLNALRKQR